jgi:SGNH domain (fused to AT3 domains)
MAFLTDEERPKVVILSNSSDYSGRILDRKSGRVLSGEVARFEWIRGLRLTIDRLLAARVAVVLVRDTPSQDMNYRDCLAYSDSTCGRPRADALSDWGAEKLVSEKYGDKITLLNFSDVLCTRTICPAMKGQQVIYRDNQHLAASFSASFWPQFSAVLRAH